MCAVLTCRIVPVLLVIIAIMTCVSAHFTSPHLRRAGYVNSGLFMVSSAEIVHHPTFLEYIQVREI